MAPLAPVHRSPGAWASRACSPPRDLTQFRGPAVSDAHAAGRVYGVGRGIAGNCAWVGRMPRRAGGLAEGLARPRAWLPCRGGDGQGASPALAGAGPTSPGEMEDVMKLRRARNEL